MAGVLFCSQEGMMNMNCKSCGAPLDEGTEKCPYCGTLTDYGTEKFRERESRKHEDERRQKLDNLPAMKYVSLALVAVLYVVTAGLYSVYWYAMRLKPLNSLGTKAKVQAWLVGIFALAYMAVCLLPQYDLTDYGLDAEIADEVYNYALGIVIVASGWLAFMTRRVLQEYAAAFMDRTQAVNVIAPSSVLLVLFGPAYLQSQINRMIRMRLLAPKI